MQVLYVWSAVSLSVCVCLWTLDDKSFLASNSYFHSPRSKKEGWGSGVSYLELRCRERKLAGGPPTAYQSGEEVSCPHISSPRRAGPIRWLPSDGSCLGQRVGLGLQRSKSPWGLQICVSLCVPTLSSSWFEASMSVHLHVYV